MPGNPLTDPHWASDFADTVERLVRTLRDRTTKPLLLAYRGLMFGLVAAFGSIFAVVLAIVIAVRGLQALLEIGMSHEDAVWLSYLIIGAVFSIAGFVIMRKRFAPELPV
jgi:hypothetical protein